jgi:hypothetical protein
MAVVSATLELVGPDCRGWVQRWPGVAEFNHLTLNVYTAAELRAREGGSEVAAAVAGGRASAHGEVDEQLCAAVQPVTGDAGDQEEQADPRTVPADATQWEEYLDPETGRSWYHNPKTDEFSWSDPKVMQSCGPTESLDHTSGDGGQQHTSPTAALTAGTGGEPSEPGLFI